MSVCKSPVCFCHTLCFPCHPLLTLWQPLYTFYVHPAMPCQPLYTSFVCHCNPLPPPIRPCHLMQATVFPCACPNISCTDFDCSLQPFCYLVSISFFLIWLFKSYFSAINHFFSLNRTDSQDSYRNRNNMFNE